MFIKLMDLIMKMISRTFSRITYKFNDLYFRGGISLIKIKAVQVRT